MVREVFQIQETVGKTYNMRRKVYLAFALLLLSCSLFVGCGDKKSDSDSGKEPVVEQSGEEVPDEEVEFDEQ